MFRNSAAIVTPPRRTRPPKGAKDSGDDLALCLLRPRRLGGASTYSLGHAARVKYVLAQLVARPFYAEVRGEDAAFRLGGDEFAFMLVGAGEADAQGGRRGRDQRVRSGRSRLSWRDDLHGESRC